MKYKFLAGLVFLLVSFYSGGQEARIQIATTSDVHGCLFPYDFEENSEGKSSLAGVAYLVDSIRNTGNNDLILLDNGDLVQGTPVSYYANFVQKKRTNLFARILNCLKYDAATIGNHDIEAGPAVYNHLKKAFHFPYLGANVITAETDSPFFEPYTIFRRKDARIAVIGLITPAVPRWLPQKLWAGLIFRDMVQSAQEWVKIVRDTEKPDLIVGLFHSGYGGERREDSGIPVEDAGRYIAENIPGFDVIFLGHDHRPRNEILVNREGREVLVLNPGNAARNLAYAELVLNRDADRKFRLISAKGQLLTVPGSLAEKRYMRKFSRDLTEIRTYANREVGEIEVPVRGVDGLFGNASLTDLVHRVQLEVTGADISFTAPLSLSAVIEPGMLYVRDLFKMYRYENFLYTMELSGSEIERYLEYSCDLWFNRMKDDTDHLLLFRDSENEKAKPVLQNPSYNFDSAAGIRYSADVSKMQGPRVTIHGMENGDPFVREKMYKVAVNSYRGSGGGGHLTSGAGLDAGQLSARIIDSSISDFRTLLMKYIQSRKVIRPLPGDNWNIFPAEFFENGRQKDRALFENGIIKY
jgi:2',3'-cyclic-nucleotide 2'-phosphodiesterase/3'-nucleotidase